MPTGFELIKQQVETKKLGGELPIVGWFHFPLADPVADDFYAETINTATAGHWDLIKIMTCGNYMPVAYGADYEFSTNPQKWDGVFHSHPITSAEDAGKLGVLDATNDTLAAEVAVDGRIVDTYKGERPVLATLFDPLSWVQELSTPMNPDWTLELMRSNPKALTHALEALQETNDHFLDALIDKGIDGIFMTTKFSRSTLITASSSCPTLSTWRKSSRAAPGSPCCMSMVMRASTWMTSSTLAIRRSTGSAAALPRI